MTKLLKAENILNITFMLGYITPSFKQLRLASCSELWLVNKTKKLHIVKGGDRIKRNYFVKTADNRLSIKEWRG